MSCDEILASGTDPSFQDTCMLKAIITKSMPNHQLWATQLSNT